MTTDHAPSRLRGPRQLLSLDPSLDLAQPGRRASDSWLRVSRPAMACLFEAIVPSESEAGLLAVQAFLGEVDRLEAMLSVFRPTSEVSLLNRDAGAGPVAIGAELFELLHLCARLARETDGAFDITAGVLSQCWGFQDRQPRVPSPEALRAARSRVGFHHVSLASDRTVTFWSPGVRINLGGIGKGHALDCGASRMLACGTETALLTAGQSSILAIGGDSDGAGWLVGLRHPMSKERRMGSVRLADCAMATSGPEEQWFEADGRRHGHIIDPRTGFPAEGVASVSVVADSAAHADGLATAFFVGGPRLAEQYCADHEGVVAVMLLADDLARPVVIGSSDRAKVEIANG